MQQSTKEVVNVFGIRYLGVEKDFLEQISSTPNRKKRNLELHNEEKEYDKNHSKRTIGHSISFAD